MQTNLLNLLQQEAITTGYLSLSTSHSLPVTGRDTHFTFYNQDLMANYFQSCEGSKVAVIHTTGIIREASQTCRQG